jgi:hypothetical protein
MQERADVRDHCAPFWQDAAREHRPEMKHPRPHFEFDIAVDCSQVLGHSHPIIAWRLVAADKYESRRQAERIAIEWRVVGRAGFRAGEIKLDRRHRIGKAVPGE